MKKILAALTVISFTALGGMNTQKTLNDQLSGTIDQIGDVAGLYYMPANPPQFNQLLETAKDLIAKGANVDHIPTAIYAFKNQPYIGYPIPELIKLLVEAGADVNNANNMGKTPLDFIMLYEPMRYADDVKAQNIYKSAEILINNGANVNYQNSVGNTPLMTLFASINDKHDVNKHYLYPIANIPNAEALVRLFLHDTQRKPLPGMSDKIKSLLYYPSARSYLKTLPSDLRGHIAQQAGLDLLLKNSEGKTTLDLAKQAQAKFQDANARAQFQTIIDLLEEATKKSESKSTTHN